MGILLCSGMMGGGGGGRSATTRGPGGGIGSGTGGGPLWPPGPPGEEPRGEEPEGEEPEEERPERGERPRRREGARRGDGLSISLPKPYFTISALPSSRTVSPGVSATYTITVTSHNGFSDLVSLSIGRLPKGCRGSFPFPHGVTPPPDESVSLPLTVTTSLTAMATPVTGRSFNVYGKSGKTRKKASAAIVVK